MDQKQIELEIEALRKQGQEALQNVHKIEGALQFALYMQNLIKQGQKDPQAKLPAEQRTGSEPV